METVTFYFLGLQNHCRRWLQPWIKRRLLLGRTAVTNLDSVLKSKDITLPTNIPIVKSMVFPVVMYKCENWTIKKAEHQRIDALALLQSINIGEDSWESLDSKETKPVNPKENQPWIFFERTDAEAEAPKLWPPDAKRQVIRKDPDTGKDWR